MSKGLMRRAVVIAGATLFVVEIIKEEGVD